MTGMRWLLLGVILLCGGCAWLSDFFAGSDNRAPPAELLPIDNAIPVRKLWDISVGAGAQGAFVKLSPALEQERLYAASHDGVVMAVSAADGQSIWRTSTGLTLTGGVGVGDGLVLVGSNKGQVVALAQTDGNEAWRAQVSSEILASPRTARGVVVVRSVDGKFTGLSARSGERLWSYSATVPALSLRGASAPLLTEGVVVAGLDNGKLLVLSQPEGRPLLEKTIAPARGRTELDRLVDIDAEPKIVGNTLYVAAYRGNITAIDLSNGDTLWSREISDYNGLDADADRIYITDESDAVQALDRRSGAVLWKQSELTGRRLSAPAAIDDYVVVGDFEGYLHWLDRDSGKIVGRIQVDDDSISVTPLARGGTVYALTQGGVLGAYGIGR